ncbi:MAG: AsmA family protein, partial [candidate division Zixibacteria bacterium]|nr:AsmA family protein [candidate division Zixibacteria bacterium]
MNKGAKIAMWVIGGLVALLVVLVIGLKLFFPVEKVRALAVEKASAMLGRTVTIGSADLSLWGGIGVRMADLSIGNPPGFAGDPFVAAKSIDVKVAFWPLLSGKIQVSRLIVESPAIAMHKLPNGTTNYSFSSMDSAAPEAAGIPDEAKPAAVAIAFDNLEIRNGRLLFADDSSNRHITAAGLNLASSVDNPTAGIYQTRGKLNIDTLLVSFMEKLPPMALAVDYNAGYDLTQKLLTIEDIQLAVNGLVLGISGKVSNQTGTAVADLHLKSDKINAADLFKLLPPDKLTALADFTVNGAFSFDAQVAYDSAKVPVLNYSGTATISDLAATRKGIDGELKITRMPVEFAVNRVTLGIEGGQFASQPFSGNLSVENFADPSVKGAIKGDLDLAFLQPFLPQKGHPELKGKTTVDLNFAGRPKDPASISVTGNLAVREASFHDSLLPEPITRFDADMSLARDTIAIRSLNVKFVSSDASFAGKLAKPFPYLLPMKKLDRTKLQKPFFQFTLKSHRFDTDKLFPEAVPGSGENRASKPIDSVPPILIPDIDGQGTCAIDTLVYSQVEITNITGKVRIKDRKVEVYDATGKVYTGSVAGNTTVDLNDFNNPRYTGKFAATQIEADDFI